MSKHKLLIVFLTFFLSYGNLFAKNFEDTTTVYYDASWKPTKIGIAFVSKQWTANGLYYQHDFYYPSLRPQMTGSYSDAEHKKREGTFVWYRLTGLKQEVITYLNNINEGPAMGWYENGRPSYESNYKKGVLIDTSLGWYESGKRSKLAICDQNGTGIEEDFFENGQKSGTGKLELGKRTGDWTFTDDNKIVSQVVKYEKDSAIEIANYNQEGVKEKGTNTVEKAAGFPGGLEGWRHFLEKNLKYPKSAQRAGKEGVVRLKFTVGKDGKPFDIEVVDGPDTALEEEGLRIMSKSPNWVPAIQHNRKVTYRFIQTITFALQ